MIRADLHVHTRFSGDSSITPKELVDSLQRHTSVKAVAITDHDTLEGYSHVHRLATAYEDLVIIPGIEVSTTQGDIILLGIEEKPAALQTLESIVDFAKDDSALIVIPHPYRVHGIGDAAEKMPADAVEIMNPWATPQQNKLAEELAKRRDLPGVAGSDAHEQEQLFVGYTEIYADPDVGSVLEAIRKGKVKAVPTRQI